MFKISTQNKKLCVWFLTTLSLSVAIGIFVGNIPPDPSSRYLPTHATLAAIVMAAIFVISGIIYQKAVGAASDVPVIHYWGRNAVVAVCADADYEIALREWQRLYETDKYIHSPHPRMLAFFTDSPEAKKSLGAFFTGSLAEWEQLRKKCSIQRSEMFILAHPEFTSVSREHSLPVNKETLYLLVFGKDGWEQACNDSDKQ